MRKSWKKSGAKGKTEEIAEDHGAQKRSRTHNAAQPYPRPIGAADPATAPCDPGFIFGDFLEVFNTVEEVFGAAPWHYIAVTDVEGTLISTLQLAYDGLVDALVLPLRTGLQSRRGCRGHYRVSLYVFREACCRGGDSHQESDERGGAHDERF